MKRLVKSKPAAGSRKRKKQPEPKGLPSTFSVRDVNRDTAKVFRACREHGRVIIRHRSGEQFAITPIHELPGPRPDFLERMRLHREKMRALGVRGPSTPEGIERLNRIIAGEE